ncbi:MAG: ABC transporter substrate-binding protein [Chloroflexota bacterium]
MRRIGNILKRIGKFLLWTILILVVLIGSIVIWLRIEPEEVTECTSDFRLIDTGVKVTCAPKVPTRLLPVSPSATQFFLAIGYAPAAHLTLIDQTAFLDHPQLEEPWEALTKDSYEIGGMPPNVEAVLNANPDLVISEYDLGTVYKAAERIAPIVELNQADDWKANILTIGEVIGEEEQAAAMLADYDNRVEILRAQFDDVSAVGISTLNVRDERLVLHLPDSFGGQIITEVGFSFPDHQVEFLEENRATLPWTTFYDISEELIELADGDALFLYGLNDTQFAEQGYIPTTELVDELLEDPLFKQLSAVENGTVYPGGNYWMRGGIYSAHAVLDDLFRYVAGVDPDEVAPNPLRQE